jgi:hypothetical protein
MCTSTLASGPGSTDRYQICAYGPALHAGLIFLAPCMVPSFASGLGLTLRYTWKRCVSRLTGCPHRASSDQGTGGLCAAHVDALPPHALQLSPCAAHYMDANSAIRISQASQPLATVTLLRAQSPFATNGAQPKRRKRKERFVTRAVSMGIASLLVCK